MKSDFLLAFNQVCSDRGLSREVVLEALETALESAYRRNAGIEASQNVMAKVDMETGKAQVFVEKQVVEEVADAIYVPLRAVFERDGAYFVYVMEDGVPKERKVVLGPSNESDVIIRESLDVGEQVCLGDFGELEARR